MQHTSSHCSCATHVIPLQLCNTRHPTAAMQHTSSYCSSATQVIPLQLCNKSSHSSSAKIHPTPALQQVIPLQLRNKSSHSSSATRYPTASMQQVIPLQLCNKSSHCSSTRSHPSAALPEVIPLQLYKMTLLCISTTCYPLVCNISSHCLYTGSYYLSPIQYMPGAPASPSQIVGLTTLGPSFLPNKESCRCISPAHSPHFVKKFYLICDLKISKRLLSSSIGKLNITNFKIILAFLRVHLHTSA